MPRIKRWFPVNHNINRDPEVWAMRREIGEKSLSVWLEFLSIADQNEGEIPGSYEELIRSVSGTCQATTRTVRAVYQRALRQLWLASEPTLHVVKYWNYHRSREPQRPLKGYPPSEPSEPSEPLKTTEPAPPEPSAGSKRRSGLDPEIILAADAIYNLDTKKYARLITWINQAQKNRYSKAAIVKALLDFFPYSSSVNGNWWAYLDKLIYKAEPRINSQRHEHEHEQRKKAEAEIPEYIKSALGGH